MISGLPRMLRLSQSHSLTLLDSVLVPGDIFVAVIQGLFPIPLLSLTLGTHWFFDAKYVLAVLHCLRPF